jgi:hypothetical protein
LVIALLGSRDQAAAAREHVGLMAAVHEMGGRAGGAAGLAGRGLAEAGRRFLLGLPLPGAPDAAGTPGAPGAAPAPPGASLRPAPAPWSPAQDVDLVRGVCAHGWGAWATIIADPALTVGACVAASTRGGWGSGAAPPDPQAAASAFLAGRVRALAGAGAAAAAAAAGAALHRAAPMVAAVQDPATLRGTIAWASGQGSLAALAAVRRRRRRRAREGGGGSGARLATGLVPAAAGTVVVGGGEGRPAFVPPAQPQPPQAPAQALPADPAL